jgi:uncharacterized protein (DUF697 family)
MSLPVSAGAMRKLLAEIEASGRGDHVLVVGGAAEHAPVLRQQFLRGRAEPNAVRLGSPEGADAYVHVLTGEPGDEDVNVLRRAQKERVPVIAVVVGLPRDIPTIPYVLATDVVRTAAGRSFPLETIARAVAPRIGEGGAPLAARVPLLRAPVCKQLVASAAWKNGVLAVATWIPGADLPVLLLNELRLVLRLAQAHGVGRARDRPAELAATVGAGFGLRALARELVDRIPVADWALKGAVAYGGTRVLGEAARLRFSRLARPEASRARQRRAADAPAAP